MVPDVFFDFPPSGGRPGLIGWDGEIGEVAGSDTARTGPSGRFEADWADVARIGVVIVATLEAVVGSARSVSKAVGGAFLGDLERDRNMPSAVTARAIDRP